MIKRVNAVGVIFENEHGQVLVLKRHPQSHEGATYGLVGGNIEPDEEAIEAAIRETQEEIGHHIDPTQLRFVHSYHWTRDDMNLKFDVYKLTVPTIEVNLELDKEENTEHLWELPRNLYKRKDLMVGLYPILEDTYKVR